MALAEFYAVRKLLLLCENYRWKRQAVEATAGVGSADAVAAEPTPERTPPSNVATAGPRAACAGTGRCAGTGTDSAHGHPHAVVSAFWNLGMANNQQHKEHFTVIFDATAHPSMLDGPLLSRRL